MSHEESKQPSGSFQPTRRLRLGRARTDGQFAYGVILTHLGGRPTENVSELLHKAIE